MLGTIVDTQLKEAGFATFNAANAFEMIKADITEEIRKVIVYDYVGKNYDPVEHYIRGSVVTEADWKLLLNELQSVGALTIPVLVLDETRREWLNHIQSVCQSLKAHT